MRTSQDTPYHKGKVTTDGGIAILAITLTLKGVLWIVPIARIKQIFESEYSAVVKGSNLEKKARSRIPSLTLNTPNRRT